MKLTLSNTVSIIIKTFHTKNIKEIKTILIKNNYPIGFINHVIKKRLKHVSQKVAELNTHTPTPWWLRTLTHKLHTTKLDRSSP